MSPRITWVVANALPLIGFVMLRVLAEGTIEWELTPVVAFVAFVACIAVGQALAVGRAQWAIATMLALANGAVVVFGVLSLGDMAGYERAAVAASHIAAGIVFSATQQRLARKRVVPLAWSAIAWIALSLLLVGATALGWHPAGTLSLFPGYRELASAAVLFAGFGLATFPRLSFRSSAS